MSDPTKEQMREWADSITPTSGCADCGCYIGPMARDIAAFLRRLADEQEDEAQESPDGCESVPISESVSEKVRAILRMRGLLE